MVSTVTLVNNANQNDRIVVVEEAEVPQAERVVYVLDDEF
jgi:hypothetical protein